MVRALDISGERYGRLVAVRRVNGSPPRWLCRCDCGTEKAVRLKDLRRNGGTKSCGCLADEATCRFQPKHGMRNTRTYRAWIGMRMRCRPTDKASAGYWERGISVCERWSSFDAFLNDMGECPPGLSLDRVDNDRGYEPGNCRWATVTQQNRNKRNIRFHTHNGETLCLKDWSIRYGVSYPALLGRLKAGWAFEDAINPEGRRARPGSANTSGVVGVAWDKSREIWIAYVHVNRRFKNLGRFKRLEDAIAARQAAEKKTGAEAPA